MSSSTRPVSLAHKLELHGEIVFTVRRAPDDFADALGELGDAVWQHSLMAPLDMIVAFHTHRLQLMTEWPRLTAAMAPTGAIWVALPRPGSGVVTDLSDDVVRANVLPTGWVDDKAISMNDAWSAVRFVARTDQRRRRR